MSRELQPCGTHAAYRRHRRRGERPCQACRSAHAAHVQEYKTRKPSYVGRTEAQRQAGVRLAAAGRARARLAAEFPERYRELCAEELKAIGEGS